MKKKKGMTWDDALKIHLKNLKKIKLPKSRLRKACGVK